MPLLFVQRERLGVRRRHSHDRIARCCCRPAADVGLAVVRAGVEVRLDRVQSRNACSLSSHRCWWSHTSHRGCRVPRQRLGRRIVGLALLVEERRDGDRGKNADDQDHDEELDQGETLLILGATAQLVKHGALLGLIGSVRQIQGPNRSSMTTPLGGSPASSRYPFGGPWLCVPPSRTVCPWHLSDSGKGCIDTPRKEPDEFGRLCYSPLAVSAGPAC